MCELKIISSHALTRLKVCRNRLTTQQYRTLRGQVLAGDGDGAMRGLERILRIAEEKAKK